MEVGLRAGKTKKLHWVILTKKTSTIGLVVGRFFGGYFECWRGVINRVLHAWLMHAAYPRHSVFLQRFAPRNENGFPPWNIGVRKLCVNARARILQQQRLLWLSKINQRGLARQRWRAQ